MDDINWALLSKIGADEFTLQELEVIQRVSNRLLEWMKANGTSQMKLTMTEIFTLQTGARKLWKVANTLYIQQKDMIDGKEDDS